MALSTTIPSQEQTGAWGAVEPRNQVAARGARRNTDACGRARAAAVRVRISAMPIGPVSLCGFVNELQQYQAATFCLVGVDHRRDRIQHHVKPPIHFWSELNRRTGADDEEASVQVRRQADQVAFVAADPMEEQQE